MAHKHSVYDTDNHFMIDDVTRAVKNASQTKTMLVQHDHNSERFTFEIPRYIDGHDMSVCNVVQIHYINIDSTTKEQKAGIYEVGDLQISPEGDDVVICSWLHSAVSVSKGIFNGDVIVEEYADILAQFEARITALEEGGVAAPVWDGSFTKGVL